MLSVMASIEEPCLKIPPKSKLSSFFLRDVQKPFLTVVIPGNTI
jgi:hypothetical protein